MIDVTDVGLVDAHAEGDRGHDDPLLRLDEPLLGLAALVVVHAGMIGPGSQPGLDQPLGQFFGRALQRDVDDRRPRFALGQGGKELLVALGGRDRRAEQGQIRPIKTRADGAAGVDVEEAADIAQHLGRGGGRQRQHPLGPAKLGEAGQPQIIGPEVVAPFRNAVGLIDGEQRDRRPLDHLAETLVDEPFGGDVQQPQPARADLVHHGAVFVQVEGRIEPPRRDAAGRQGVDLVLHQGDQRRDDQRQARQHQGRQLVAERFAAAGGKDGRRRFAGQQMPDHLALSRFEVGKAEVLTQHGQGVRHAAAGTVGEAVIDQTSRG